ncbi:MAG: S8 family serine peptidase, partial [Candidatus Thermoplasmatota archaeon]|nr:S8 family serine peptidase [Candidatus Thermoplasmatota archaeon]
MERDMGRDLFDFDRYTGKGVKVAVVDSGIDPSHPDIGGIEGGVRISLDDKGEIILGQDGSDAVGHGTACAGIIRKKAPGVRLYSVRIFDDEALSAEGKVLVEAIRWCVDHRIHVINLSLGATRRELISPLRRVCDYAQEKGVMIVSAEHNEGVESFPASFPNVFGVTAGQVYEKHAYLYRENHAVEFVARGDPQRVCWLNPRYIFMGGTSFAAPYLSALIAMILEKTPQADFNHIKQILITNCSEEKVRHSHRGWNAMRRSQHGACFAEAPSDSESKKLNWIRKAAIYPFNKEMHALVRFRDLLKFEVVGVGDPIGKRLVGRDAGEAIGAEPSGIIITHKLDQLLEDADTLILGYVDQLSRIVRRDVLGEILEKALGLGKHIYSLAPIDRSAYAEVFEKARQRRV